jgi:hypothetical protein
VRAKKKELPPCPFCEGRGTLFYFPYPGEADCHYCGGTGAMWGFVKNVGDQLLGHLGRIDDPELRRLLPKLRNAVDEIVRVTKRRR